jgi:Fic-DOC domain mobile mystery protein B
MELDLDYKDGQTPLDDDEKEGLRIPTIATRGELDEFEQQNIEQAMQWILGHSIKQELLLTVSFVKAIHKKMYGNVWKWAGEFRKSNKNIGVDKWQVQTQLRQLLDDTQFWIENETYPPDEIAVRFKHKLVSIHCFANGNGRHSRLMADIIIEKIYAQPVFTWGAGNLVKQSDARTMYIKAVKAADAGDILPLLLFARS